MTREHCNPESGSCSGAEAMIRILLACRFNFICHMSGERVGRARQGPDGGNMAGAGATTPPASHHPLRLSRGGADPPGTSRLMVIAGCLNIW